MHWSFSHPHVGRGHGEPWGLHSGILASSDLSGFIIQILFLPLNFCLFLILLFVALAPVGLCSLDHPQSALKSVFLNKDSFLPKRNCGANRSNSRHVSLGTTLNGLFRLGRPYEMRKATFGICFKLGRPYISGSFREGGGSGLPVISLLVFQPLSWAQLSDPTAGGAGVE